MPADMRRGLGVYRGGKHGMREPDLPAVELDQPHVERGHECLERVAAERGRQHGHARLWFGGDEQKCVASRLGQGLQPVLRELDQRRSAPVRRAAIVREFRARELDGVERIAARGGMHAHEPRTRQCGAELLRDDPMDRADAQRADLEAFRFGLWHKTAGHAGAAREDHTNAFFQNQSAKREHERTRRRSIEPVGIVDRDHRHAAGCSERGEGRDGDGSLVRRLFARLAKQQRDLDRASLRSGQLVEYVLSDRAQDVPETRVGEARLGLARHGRENVVAQLGCMLHRGAPERRLSDPRLPFQHQDRRRRRLEPRLECGELGVAADDLMSHRQPGSAFSAPAFVRSPGHETGTSAAPQRSRTVVARALVMRRPSLCVP